MSRPVQPRHSLDRTVSGDPKSTDAGARGGSYRKGRLKREEILRAAFAAFAEQGFRGTSVRQIAQKVGLTQQGLMHHFASKEELLAEVLALRDTLDRERFDTEFAENDTIDRLRLLVRLNQTRPGLVRLFSTLSTEATDPEHPAHAFFATRYRDMTKLLTERFGEDDSLIEGHDAEVVSRLLLAMMDGLQIQWLMAEEVEMAPLFDAFAELLRGRPARVPSFPPPSKSPSVEPRAPRTVKPTTRRAATT